MKVFNKTDEVIIVSSYSIPPNDSIEITKEALQVLMTEKSCFLEVKTLLDIGSLAIVP